MNDVMPAAPPADPLPSPKAMAIHPWGRVFIVTGSASQAKAEADALSDCDTDPGRGGKDGPCLLYASGNKVVLSEHRTAAAPDSRAVRAETPRPVAK